MSQGEGEDPVVDVDDRLDSKGTGGERISWVWLRRRETVEGQGFRVEVEGNSLWVGFYF